MNVIPMYDRVVVEPHEVKEKTSGGIILPETAKDKPQKGTVVAVGKGRPMEDGGIFSPMVKVGDVILFGKFTGSEIEIDDKTYLIMRESDILAILPKKGSKTESMRITEIEEVNRNEKL